MQQVRVGPIEEDLALLAAVRRFLDEDLVDIIAQEDDGVRGDVVTVQVPFQLSCRFQQRANDQYIIVGEALRRPALVEIRSWIPANAFAKSMY
jgi:hypothetical protein